jgi:hypothetical protein
MLELQGSWREKGGAVRVWKHLYRCVSWTVINVTTFVPVRITTRYKCVVLTLVPVGATTQYKCEAFVPGGLEEEATCPCEGAFVLSSASNWYKCSYSLVVNKLQILQVVSG